MIYNYHALAVIHLSSNQPLRNSQLSVWNIAKAIQDLVIELLCAWKAHDLKPVIHLKPRMRPETTDDCATFLLIGR